MKRALFALFAFAMQPAICQASFVYRLDDHPNGNRNPPPYGLRVDNLFLNDGIGGTTTFSFGDARSNVTATVDPAAGSLSISGVARGGVDNGKAYSHDVMIEIKFLFTGITIGGTLPNDPQIIVPPGTGFGTLKVISANSANAASLVGNVYNLEAKANSSNNKFNLKNGTHRGYNGISGWGWVTALDSKGNPISPGSTQDFLFTAHPSHPLPEPGSIVVWSFLGLIGWVFAWRRRPR